MEGNRAMLYLFLKKWHAHVKTLMNKWNQVADYVIRQQKPKM